MLTNKPQLLLLTMLLPFVLMAQHANRHPGYYLNQQGDTVKCEIDLANWIRNPNNVHAFGSNGPLELRPEETKGFGVYGIVDYVSANVTYHTEKITGTDLPSKYSDNVETAWCFLKLLSAGNVALYELMTNQRVVFFISDHGTDPTELLYRVSIIGVQVREDQQYKQVLLRIFNKQGSENYETRIERMSYDEGDLLSLFKRLNNTPGKVYSKRTSGDFEFIFFAGWQSYLFPSSFNGVYSVNNRFSPAFSAFAGTTIFYNITPNSGQFKVGLSADYSTYNVTQNESGIVGNFFSQNFYDTTTYSEHLHASNAFVTLKLFLQTTLNPYAKVKLYVKAGIWYSYSIKQTASIYSDYNATTVGTANGRPPSTSTQNGRRYVLSIAKSFGNVLTATGIKIGKSQVELAYGIPSFTGRFDGSGTRFKIGSLSLSYGYVLGKKK